MPRGRVSPADGSTLAFLFRTHYKQLDRKSRCDGDMIRELCRITQLTPDELAHLLRISPSTMTRYLNGTSHIPDHTALLIRLFDRFVRQVYLGEEFDYPVLPTHHILK